MPIPSFQTILVPVLKVAIDGNEHSTTELREQIAGFLKLTPEEIVQKLPSGRQSVFTNRVAWAIVYLAKAGALQRVKRGVFEITDRGRELLEKHPEAITVQTLNQFPEFLSFYNREPLIDGKTASKVDLNQTPEEQLISADQLLRETLASEVLEAVKKTTPAFFEKLVIELFSRYGLWRFCD